MDSVNHPKHYEFQSTHPVRGATARADQPIGSAEISIHAPREGCDLAPVRSAPRRSVFQSTHPVRGATNATNGLQQFIQDFNPRTP